MPTPTLQDLAPDGHDLAADPHPVYATLRARGPVHRVLAAGRLERPLTCGYGAEWGGAYAGRTAPWMTEGPA